MEKETTVLSVFQANFLVDNSVTNTNIYPDALLAQQEIHEKPSVLFYTDKNFTFIHLLTMRSNRLETQYWSRKIYMHPFFLKSVLTTVAKKNRRKRQPFILIKFTNKCVLKYTKKIWAEYLQTEMLLGQNLFEINAIYSFIKEWQYRSRYSKLIFIFILVP